jgi:N-alpha-acetyltransferase 40
MTFLLLRAQRDKEEIIFSFSAPTREKSLIRFLEIRGRVGYNTLNRMCVCFLTGETLRHTSRHRETFASRKMTSLSRGEDEEERKTRVANAVPKTWLEKTALSVSDDAFSKRLFVRCYASHLEIENNENVRDWMYALTETNMREMYEQTWGWNSLEKRRELSDQNAKFVLVFTQKMKRGEEGKEAKVALNTTDEDEDEEKPVAFAHYRFEVDDDDVASVYIYELQVEQTMKRSGLGRVLMRACEKIGCALGLKHAALTVLKTNQAARSFYAKIGYEETDHAPVDAHYVIMRKRI